jgi:hypothetical protein
MYSDKYIPIHASFPDISPGLNLLGGEEWDGL